VPLLIYLVGPAIIALLGLVLVIVCIVKMRTARKGAAVLCWAGIVFGGLLVAGIGTCYGMVFTIK
jgi:hypothetical protein